MSYGRFREGRPRVRYPRNAFHKIVDALLGTADLFGRRRRTPHLRDDLLPQPLARRGSRALARAVRPQSRSSHGRVALPRTPLVQASRPLLLDALVVPEFISELDLAAEGQHEHHLLDGPPKDLPHVPLLLDELEHRFRAFPVLGRRRRLLAVEVVPLDLRERRDRVRRFIGEVEAPAAG